jgi:hypothetical protein
MALGTVSATLTDLRTRVRGKIGQASNGAGGGGGRSREKEIHPMQEHHIHRGRGERVCVCVCVRVHEGFKQRTTDVHRASHRVFVEIHDSNKAPRTDR